MLSQLVDASSATVDFGQDDLLDVLRASRRNNAAAGVTGALLYSGGNFLQVLEGPADAVQGVFHRVGKDPRHRGVLVLLKTSCAERQFPDWAMGFKSVDGTSAEEAAGARSLFALTEPGPVRAQKMLHSFRALAGRDIVSPSVIG